MDGLDELLRARARASVCPEPRSGCSTAGSGPCGSAGWPSRAVTFRSRRARRSTPVRSPKAVTALVVVDAAARGELDLDVPCSQRSSASWPDTPRAIMAQTTGRPNDLPGPDEDLAGFVARVAALVGSLRRPSRRCRSRTRRLLAPPWPTAGAWVGRCGTAGHTGRTAGPASLVVTGRTCAASPIRTRRWSCWPTPPDRCSGRPAAARCSTTCSPPCSSGSGCRRCPLPTLPDRSRRPRSWPGPSGR